MYTHLVGAWENGMYALTPSAARAFAYGGRHFNAEKSYAYDIERARHFFTLAAEKDPTLPYVYHELARIDFLKGDFPSALAKINFQISLHGDTAPNSYYIRGLIQGYAGDYDAAARNYEHYLSLLRTPNWAGITDYSWVLLKAERNADAARVTDEALGIFPENPWLLNANAIAHFELGDYERALVSVRKASRAAMDVSEQEWLAAYPGNDPESAPAGLASFQAAVEDNMHRIEYTLASSTVQ
jgi:tetratricopeptide (TPR) repeat protein